MLIVIYGAFQPVPTKHYSAKRAIWASRIKSRGSRTTPTWRIVVAIGVDLGS